MNHTRAARLIAMLLVLGALLGGCAVPTAPTVAQESAAPTAAQASAAPAAPAIAMSDAPQAVAPQAFVQDFVEAQAAYQLIDVRTPEEYASGHIAGAVNIPLDQISGRLGEISKDEPVVLYCRSGNRSTQAAALLQQAGYTGIYNLGGIQAWQAAGLPVE